jgi:hypothetical protein
LRRWRSTEWVVPRAPQPGQGDPKRDRTVQNDIDDAAGPALADSPIPKAAIRTALDLELQEGTVVADTIGGTPCVFLAGLHRAWSKLGEWLPLSRPIGLLVEPQAEALELVSVCGGTEASDVLGTPGGTGYAIYA